MYRSIKYTYFTNTCVTTKLESHYMKEYFECNYTSLLYGWENIRDKEGTQCMHDVNTGGVHVIFTPPRLSQEPDTIANRALILPFMSPVTIKHTWVFIKRPKFWLDFNQIRIFSTDFGESPQYQISGKSAQLGAADTCDQTDGRMDGRTRQS